MNEIVVRTSLLLGRFLVPFVMLLLCLDWLGMPSDLGQATVLETEALHFYNVTKRNAAALVLSQGDVVEVSCSQERDLCRALQAGSVKFPLPIKVARFSGVQGPWVVHVDSGGATQIAENELPGRYRQAKVMQLLGAASLLIISWVLWSFPPGKSTRDAA